MAGIDVVKARGLVLGLAVAVDPTSLEVVVRRETRPQPG